MKNVKETVIQFGEGGFLRGFVDWMIQKMNDQGLTNHGVVVVQPIAKGLCDTLTAQGCRYTHLIRGVEGVEATTVDCITRCVKPYDDYAAYMALAENPDFKYIISNTTEAGIAYRAEDRLTDQPPVSFPAKVCALLYKRFTLGFPGFVFLPCELIDQNGSKLRDILLQYAADWQLGEDFARWIREENVFCNTLVDRINTGFPQGEVTQYDDPMLNTSEFFHLWVIEGPAEALADLPFEKAGLNVIICDSIEMYRTRKVRILNGAHTSLVPYALLSGRDTVRSCIEDPVMLAHLKACVFDEIIPTLDLPREELLDYANSVLERFANPYINHYLQSIALNSVSKFKVRVLPSILEYIRRFDAMPRTLLFAFAQLIRFYKEGTPDDDPAVMAFMKTASVPEILARVDYWGEDLSFLCAEVEDRL